MKGSYGLCGLIVEEVAYACECEDLDGPRRRALYRVLCTDGTAGATPIWIVCSYCDDCAAEAAGNWNGTTLAIEPLGGE